MPASIKLQEEYGDDLAIIFVESQGTSDKATAKFAMKMRWFGNEAMWTSEPPFSTGSRTLPSFALISAEGKVLSIGNHMTSSDKDLIEDAVKNAARVPADTPKDFVKAWKSFGKGKYAKAIAAAHKVGSKKSELASDARVVVSQFEARIQRRLKRANWLADNGYPVAAKKMGETLVANLKGTDEMLAAAREFLARFDTEEWKLELEAAGKLNSMLKKVYEDGRDKKLFDKLEKLTKKYSGTKAAKRALPVVSMCP